MLRAEHGRLKLQNTELTGELNIRIDQLNSLEIEYAKVVQRCDVNINPLVGLQNI